MVSLKGKQGDYLDSGVFRTLCIALTLRHDLCNPCSVRHHFVGAEASINSGVSGPWLLKRCVMDEKECSNRTLRCTMCYRSVMSALRPEVLPR